MTEASLSKLLDLEEIRNLRIRYSHYLDTNHVEALGELFASDGVCDAGRGVWVGREEIRAGLSEAFKAYDHAGHGSYPFLHAVTNHWVEIIDADTAQGRCYLLDLETAEKPERDPWLLLGSYADEYRRIDGRWYINRTRLDIVWPARNGGGGLPGLGLVLPTRPVP
ncbi:nuclear transport factor 2 family protein [Paraburkholderia sp. HD33-4]|uniref:nuclear transport factor 2 family protein n=1 Tax=Paraburkholderia sp. HD33-4 TaxID=2883242 RepID=UPI001F2F6FB2|nr:nuclear transport factor 2 family protein [Paraburkholderia sp. HD33-4]